MPLICPKCKESVTSVDVELHFSAAFNTDGHIVLPAMVSADRLVALIKDEIAAISCQACGADLYEDTAHWKFIDHRTQQIDTIVKGLGLVDKEARTCATVINCMPEDTIDFWATYFS